MTKPEFRPGGALLSIYGKIRDRVDSEGKYERKKLRIMGSWDSLLFIIIGEGGGNSGGFIDL